MKNLWSLEANIINKLYVSNQISLKEIIDSHEQRFYEVNPKINAIPQETFQYARKRIEIINYKRKQGIKLGPLAGVPVTIKINTDQTGFATTNGLVTQKNLIAKKNSTVVDNIEKADGIIIGRTNTPAFSMRWFTNNQIHGHTLNPHNKKITPGGSSGGAAAAAASGLGAIAHGTDIAGSIRFPAYACGIHGMRPSLGRVPMINYSLPDRFIGGQIMAVSGPLARSIKDIELGLEALSQENYDDPWWTPISKKLPKLSNKIALLTKIKGMNVDKIIVENLINVANKLDKMGWIIEEVKGPNFEEIARYQAVLWLAEFRRNSGEIIYKENNRDAIFIFEQMSKLCNDTSVEQFMDALKLRAFFGREWTNFFRKYPLILCPISGTLPFDDLIDVRSEKDFNFVFDAMLPQIAPPYLGLPAICFSNGFTSNNIPIGVQFISSQLREDKLLQVTYDLEKIYPKIRVITPDF